ncbi:geranylgeranylglycerol-phosphate geranylgeranyltransferase [Capnocytophaga catalasegens]|uniref:Ubiquinone biosynthesis protein UbiA n=1 Tax=Capnocytophaga catalasegens TaxID=1004260 RepID=A0AAV5AYF5_9FLAO|nr:geranylgeranylglycerol-phosphate geranylgeranyltransferase [Capnocytophaga catalasegens]GIZ15964.1 ubiquinone biosynthesis protein UbiA [Capnocytophaga catalasegens]GJM50451.1 ubiquinone biosynthesis protein UbiA [Capnocytophaga catalasegens]GJM53946.1 ubiquinone biosynthesis protein UbiA [Capnocytophaga catalasegens]
MTKIKYTLLKILGLFSVIRGYNILIICIAQYLTSIFILSQYPTKEVLFDDNLFMLILAGALSIAGGYIINGFYDKEKDLINKPYRVMINRLVSQHTKLTLYFLLNFFSIIVASYVSFRAVIFFSLYIFGMWIYSHKLKKIAWIGNIVSATLSIIPFFAIFIYYKNFEHVIFFHAMYLFLLILIRELVKDLENIKGDFTFDYQTIPVKYGEVFSKIIISVLTLLTLIPIYFLLYQYHVGLMKYYFIIAGFLLIYFLAKLWKGQNQKTYHSLHNLLKITLITGVFSILLIHPEKIIQIFK